MLLCIANRNEIGRTIVVAKLLVPLRAFETASVAVNLAQPFERRDRHLVGCETYDWAEALVSVEDAADLTTCAALPPYPCGKKGSAGVDGGKFGQWGDKGGVDNEMVEKVDEDESYRERGMVGHSDVRNGEFVEEFCFQTRCSHRNTFWGSTFCIERPDRYSYTTSHLRYPMTADELPQSDPELGVTSRFRISTPVAQTLESHIFSQKKA